MLLRVLWTSLDAASDGRYCCEDRRAIAVIMIHGYWVAVWWSEVKRVRLNRKIVTLGVESKLVENRTTKKLPSN